MAPAIAAHAKLQFSGLSGRGRAGLRPHERQFALKFPEIRDLFCVWPREGPVRMRRARTLRASSGGKGKELADRSRLKRAAADRPADCMPGRSRNRRARCVGRFVALTSLPRRSPSAPSAGCVRASAGIAAFSRTEKKKSAFTGCRFSKAACRAVRAGFPPPRTVGRDRHSTCRFRMAVEPSEGCSSVLCARFFEGEGIGMRGARHREDESCARLT